jgi:hypothetical protein
VLMYGNYKVSRWTMLVDSCVGIGAGDIVAEHCSPASPTNCDLLHAGRRAFALREADHKGHELVRLSSLWEPKLRDLVCIGQLSRRG